MSQDRNALRRCPEQLAKLEMYQDVIANAEKSGDPSYMDSLLTALKNNPAQYAHWQDMADGSRAEIAAAAEALFGVEAYEKNSVIDWFFWSIQTDAWHRGISVAARVLGIDVDALEEAIGRASEARLSQKHPEMPPEMAADFKAAIEDRFGPQPMWQAT